MGINVYIPIILELTKVNLGASLQLCVQRQNSGLDLITWVIDNCPLTQVIPSTLAI